MEILENFLDKFKRSLKDPNDLMLMIFRKNNDLEDLIIELNQEQLYESGTDSIGNSLGTYTARTVQIKRAKGQRTDHVTLKDTGEFYASFKVRILNDGIEIDANSIKDDVDLFEKYGIDILGLDNLSQYQLNQRIIHEIQKIIIEMVSRF